MTVPVELAMKGIPSLVRMRSTTRYSVSLMTFEFAQGTDIYWARAQVGERLRRGRRPVAAMASTAASRRSSRRSARC